MTYKEYFTEDDCRTILEKISPELQLKNYTLKPFTDELRGYLGEHLLLKIETTNSKSFQYFAKSTKTASLSECLKEAKFFEREILVYNFIEEAKKLVPKLQKNSLPVPKFIHSNVHEMLILEDLSEQNFVGGNLKFTQKELEKAIEALAKFHAVSIIFEETKRKQLGRKKYELTEDFGDFPDPIFRRNKESVIYKSAKSAEIGVLTLIDLYMKDEKEKADAFKEKFSKAYTKMFKILNEKNNYRKVISNGDLWGNNVLFKYKNKKVVDSKLVDFQFVRYVPPACDLTSLIYFTTERKLYQRIHHFYELYYEFLRRELKNVDLKIETILPLDEFRETCRIYMENAKITWLIYRQMSSANYLPMQDVGTDISLYKEVLLGKKRSWFVTENFKNDKPYREFVKNILYDVYDCVTKTYSVESCFRVVENTIGKNYTLLDYTIQPLSVRGGFLGEHCILEMLVKTKKEMKLRYFLKQPPSLKSQRDFADDTRVLFKENQFYQKLLPDFVSNNIKILADISAKCYHVDDDGLVLDDLQNLGFKSLNKRKTMGLNDVLVILKTLAKLHASGLIYEERLGMNLYETYKDEFTEAFYSETQSSIDLLIAANKGIEAQIKIFNANSKMRDLHSKISKIVNAYSILTKPSRKFRNTICHGDLWANNILSNSQKAYLIDFQSYRYAPPAHDVMQFIYLATNREFRSGNLNRVLEEYLENLNKILVENSCTPIERSTFFESCEFEKIMAVIQSVTHFHNVLLSDEMMDYLFKDADYCKKVLFEDRSDNIRKSCACDPVYRERNGETIADAADLCDELTKKGFDFDNIIRL